MVEAAQMYIIHEEVMEELARADKKYGPMKGERSGIRTIKCEVEELHGEIDSEIQNLCSKRKEAVQVAAMAMKFIRDCC